VGDAKLDFERIRGWLLSCAFCADNGRSAYYWGLYLNRMGDQILVAGNAIGSGTGTGYKLADAATALSLITERLDRLQQISPGGRLLTIDGKELLAVPAADVWPADAEHDWPTAAYFLRERWRAALYDHLATP
jgi:hypothetical protein